MSEIDLDRLIVRQTYFVPVESSKLKDAILEELEACDPPIDDIYSWGIAEEHRLSFVFHYDPKYGYLHDLSLGKKWGTRNFKKFVKEKSEEYDALGMEAFFRELVRIRPDVPAEIYCSIVKEEENGCLCRVECRPFLYIRLHYPNVRKEIETDDFEMQSAFLNSRRFLETVFESGLSATLITEEKKLPPQVTTQFLVNDEASHQILDKVETMLERATAEALICGWVGTLLLPKLKKIKQNGINIRIMTHKSTKLKGKKGRQDVQRAHRELVSLLGKKNISMNPECHFRALAVDNKALVGSMDFNAISLTGTHREFAIYTEIPEIVRKIRNYFNQIFTPLKE